MAVYYLRKGDSIRTKTIEQLKKADPLGSAFTGFTPSSSSSFHNCMNRYMMNRNFVIAEDAIIGGTDYNREMNGIIKNYEWSWYVWMFDWESISAPNDMEIE